MLLPGHPGGFNRYNKHFCTDANNCDLGQQADLYTKTMKKLTTLSMIQCCRMTYFTLWFGAWNEIELERKD